jgi:hypothetical protein
MTLRNGKQYLKYISEDFSDLPAPLVKHEWLSPNINAIVNLLKKITNCYDFENFKNKKNITATEYINQKIRDYRELFYLAEYYFETLNTPRFIYFWMNCKKKSNYLIVQLNNILNGSNPNVTLTGNDKENAMGLLNDLKNFLRLLEEI